MHNTVQNTIQGQNYFPNPGNQFWGQFTGIYYGSGSGITGIPTFNGNNTWTGVNAFSNASNSFTGGGAGLTNLNPGNIAGGTFASVTFLGNASGTAFGTSLSPISFAGIFNGTFGGTLGSSGSPVVGWFGTAGNLGVFYGSGTFGTSETPATFYGSGVGYSSSSGGSAGAFYGVFTGSNASDVVSFVGLATAAQSALEASTVPIGGLLSGTWEAATYGAPLSGSATLGTAGSTNMNFIGTFTGGGTGSSIFSGDGSGLTNLNGSNIASGTVNPSFLPKATSSALGIVVPDNSTITVSDGVISSTGSQTPWASDISGGGFSLSDVTDVTATGFYGDGSNLTNLGAVNMPSGTFPGDMGVEGYLVADPAAVTDVGLATTGQIVSNGPAADQLGVSTTGSIAGANVYSHGTYYIWNLGTESYIGGVFDTIDLKDSSGTLIAELTFISGILVTWETYY